MLQMWSPVLKPKHFLLETPYVKGRKTTVEMKKGIRFGLRFNLIVAIYYFELWAKF